MKKKGVNRRDFFKIIGATTGVAATGCGRELPEKIIPYLVQPDEVIPGVATWYTGTCHECSAGCGVLVRTREGRAVKLEGNPAHPVNRGGLCALGQSALQAHYDPDRIREPLKRDVNGVFQTISWKEAIETLSTAISKLSSSQKFVLLTNPVSGSLEKLLGEFSKKLKNTSHISYEALGRNTLDLAAEQCFGEGVRTHYQFDKAHTIVSFGADFLETWISPVEFARDWAKTRKPDSHGEIGYFAQIEPRLSLTGSNADHWVKNAPGSEVALLLALLKFLVSRGGAKGVSDSLKSRISLLVRGLDKKKLLEGTGVTEKALEELAERLVTGGPSLVLAGRSAGEHEVQVLANLANVLLGNIGETVLIRRGGQAVQDEMKAVENLVAEMSAKDSDIGVLLVSGTNPAYSLPKSMDFAQAASKVPLMVAVSSHLDETTSLATLVLPKSSSLESWLDSEPAPGVYSLNQPAMQPLYETQSLGDTLLSIAGKLDISFDGAGSFYDYLRTEWKRRTGTSGFEKRWLEFVEKGGDWSGRKQRSESWSLQVGATELPVEKLVKRAPGLRLMVFPTLNSFDGSGANRPWLQELPNPVSASVWGSWIEVHPDTAKKHNLSSRHAAQIQTKYGTIEAPLFITEHVHPETLAVPLGQGHKRYGRYAKGVGVNAMRALGAGRSLLSSVQEVRSTTWSDELVRVQGEVVGSEDQGKRGIVEVKQLSELSHKGEHHGGEHQGEGNAHGGGHAKHEPKQMYEQMEHPRYRWGMSIDLSSCTGCSACVVACYAENNVPVVGKELCAEGREMSWIQMQRYYSEDESQPSSGFIPMLCQHCGNAPCEPVCPVYATYHNEEGLNAMVYNRCVGTRYCSNNCSYKVRRFNWFHYDYPEPLNWQLNPDVTVREVGVMEKCSFCVQRIREGTNNAKNEGRPVKDGEIQPACASSCPTSAIRFGNLLDEKSEVSENAHDGRAYKVLDHHINTQPAVSYLARVRNDKVKLS